MKFGFVAGFGPIVRDAAASRQFWADAGFGLSEIAPDYYGDDGKQGVKAFALWPLQQAAENTFGTTDWPADLPIPQAWIELDVPQCGYCQSGMIMAAAALLKAKPKPTDADIDAAMTNICRCGTFQEVRKAIHAAAKA